MGRRWLIIYHLIMKFCHILLFKWSSYTQILFFFCSRPPILWFSILYPHFFFFFKSDQFWWILISWINQRYQPCKVLFGIHSFLFVGLMPSSHLACDGSMEPIASFPCGLCEASVWRQEPAVRFSYVFTGSATSGPLWFCLAGSYTNLKNRKSVDRRHVVGGIAQSPHRQRTETARSKTVRWRHGHRTRLPSGGCGNCTATPLIAGFPYNLRAASVRIYPGLPPRACTRNCTMLVDNVNTYAIARSHLWCPKHCTENRRQIYRTAPGANVN